MELTLDQALEAGLKLQQAGRLAEAESAYRRVLAAQPTNAPALHMLGVLSFQLRRPEAESLIRRALELQPNYPSAWNNLGHALESQGQIAAAVECYENAVRLRPNYPEALYNIGHVFHEQGKLDEAIDYYQRAILHRPDYYVALNNISNALSDAGRLDLALAAIRQAVAFQPGIAEGYNNLATVLDKVGRLDDANEAARHAITLRPDLGPAICNLANLLFLRGDVDTALSTYRKALVVQPNLPDIHANFGMALLAAGQTDEGWQEYEWRLRTRDYQSRHKKQFASAPWDGGDLAGKTILLRAEQGIGDTIMFARFATDVAARGGRVILEVQPELVRLFAKFPGVEQVIPGGPNLAQPSSPPPFDVHIPLMSLPLALGATTFGDSELKPPYLKADPILVGDWQERLSTESRRLKVGLVWAGGGFHKRDAQRSIPLLAMAPLAHPDILFVSLQVGAAAEQMVDTSHGLRLVDHTMHLSDFADTAAAIAALDLVVTVDTAVAHLAGALGKETLLLLDAAADFRWLRNRSDTPWYPSMRLLRQALAGSWDDPIEQAAAELARRAGAGG
jgi:tetratricopeptide (TPR) repeat protein